VIYIILDLMPCVRVQIRSDTDVIRSAECGVMLLIELTVSQVVAYLYTPFVSFYWSLDSVFYTIQRQIKRNGESICLSSVGSCLRRNVAN
jgi:hypothetical protein